MIAPILLGIACLGSLAHADTIVLKNGRRIVGENVTRENGKVNYETPAGRVSLPESLVASIERDDLGMAAYPPRNAANLAIGPPPQPSPQSLGGDAMDTVIREVVHDDRIDRDALARFDAAAGGGADAKARAVTANAAASQFEYQRGDLSAALAHSQRALTLAPDEVTVLLNVAYLYLRRGEYSTAVDYLERAHRAAPDSPDVAKLMGWADYGLNRIPQAVADWKRAQQLRPDAEVAKALDKASRDLAAENDFREGASAHFVVRYNGTAAPDLARAIMIALEDDFREISAALQFAPSGQIAVVLYTGQTFADITRAPGWVGALNDGRIRIPVQGLSTVTPQLAAVLKHELTHSFVTEKTQGRCPVWLQEGLAQWMEGKRSASAAAGLVAMYDHQQDPSLTLLESTWMSQSSDSVAIDYAWSLAVVEGIQAADSSDMLRLLDRLTNDSSAENAVKSALHMDYAELARSTAAYLRQTYLRQP